MSTPYDNHDPGYSREDREMAERYAVDLDAPEQEKCYSCGKPFSPAELNKDGDCPACVELMRSEEALAAECPHCNHMRGSAKCCGLVEVVEFMTSASPSMAGCLGLMGVAR